MTGTVKDKKTAIITAVFFSALLSIVGNVQAQELATLDREISQVIDHIAGAVATVEARQQPSRAPIFPDQSRIFSRPVKAVVGSGLLIDSVGHILTSLRLVDGYDDFSVEIDGQTMAASLVGFDRRHHLAVLKVDSVFHSYLDVSPFPPVTGRLALAYGHAIDHTGYPALGIIAGRQTDGSYLVSGTVLPGLLGGGIFDLRGKLIGVISSGNVAVNDYSGTWGGIMMLPASVAINSADRIICCGNREAGYLGVRTTSIELVSPGEKILGEAVVVSVVTPGSPAEAIGLRVGDIITRFNFRKVSNDREFQRLVGSTGPDSTVYIEFIRGNRHMNARVSLVSNSQYGAVKGNSGFPDGSRSQTLMAIELQKRIDSMQTEMQRLQAQLERLLGQAGSAR